MRCEPRLCTAAGVLASRGHGRGGEARRGRGVRAPPRRPHTSRPDLLHCGSTRHSQQAAPSIALFQLTDRPTDRFHQFSDMFGLGGALKNVTSKAGELLEKKKGEVSTLADEKKKVATEILEEQVTKTTEALSQTKLEAEKAATDTADEATGLVETTVNAGIAEVEKTVDEKIKEANTEMDKKLEEADKFLDAKREDVVQAVTDAGKKVNETSASTQNSLLGKAKGFLKF